MTGAWHFDHHVQVAVDGVFVMRVMIGIVFVQQLKGVCPPHQCHHQTAAVIAVAIAVVIAVVMAEQHCSAVLWQQLAVQRRWVGAVRGEDHPRKRTVPVQVPMKYNLGVE